MATTFSRNSDEDYMNKQQEEKQKQKEKEHEEQAKNEVKLIPGLLKGSHGCIDMFFLDTGENRIPEVGEYGIYPDDLKQGVRCATASRVPWNMCIRVEAEYTNTSGATLVPCLLYTSPSPRD